MRSIGARMSFLAFFFVSTWTAAQKSSIKSPDDAETAAIHDYRLSMSRLERAAAAGDEILKLRSTDPALAKQIDAAFIHETPLDDQARTIDSQLPQVATILRAHGFTTREFLIVRFALVMDVYYVDSKQEDGTAIDPEAVLPANVAFLEKNLAQVRALAIRIFAGLEN